MLAVAIALALAADDVTPRGPFDPPLVPSSPGMHDVPEDGRVGVPTNPLLLVRVFATHEVELVDDGAAIVPTTSSATTAFAGEFDSVLRVSLDAELRPRTRYRLLERDDVPAEQEPLDLLEFTTGDGPDDVIPGDVEARVDDGGVLFVSANEDLVALDVSIDAASSRLLPWLEEGVQLPLVQQDANVVVTALDAAGNSADPVTIDARVGGGCGCAASSPASSLLATLLLLGARRRRRS